MRGQRRIANLACAAVAGLGISAPPGLALDDVSFTVPGTGNTLTEALRGASLVLQAQREGRSDPQDLFAAAQSDYARLTGVLYAAGRYSGVISIRIDGREAGGIAPLNAPTAIGTIAIEVQPGAPFTFGAARVGPLAAGTALPEGFAPGQRAQSGLIREAAETAVEGWRQAGHPRAAIGSQSITANHPAALLDARIGVDPGPRATFGALRFSGAERMREGRLQKIAGFPSGAVYSPEDLRKAADRLRRTGVFRSVALVEDETLAPGDRLDVTATVIEEVPRRFGFGAEIASFEGLTLRGFWLHRNLLGGAERVRVEAEIAQIGAQQGGVDYRLGTTFERPASFSPDTALNFSAAIGQLNEKAFRSSYAEIGAGLTHIFSDQITARIGLEYGVSRVTDRGDAVTPPTTREFRNVALPVGVLWDRRDNAFDARAGTYVDAEAKPFVGLAGTGSGVRFQADLRAYQALGDRIVLAGRLQAGAVAGASIGRSPRDYLFFSGGGGTVRGQPYQSLGIPFARAGLAGPAARQIGGTRFIAASAEVRAKVTNSIGVVAFYDFGSVGINDFVGGSAGSHAGAGIGLRYATGIGPIRLDVAAPVSGSTGRGAQIYIGIGQAF